MALKNILSFSFYEIDYRNRVFFYMWWCILTPYKKQETVYENPIGYC